MPYKNLSTLSLDQIIDSYNSTFKALAIAKDKLEKDGRIIGKELEQKNKLIALLEETYPSMKSAKIYYDKKNMGFVKAELEFVHYRLQHVKILCKKFPYYPNCEVEKIILSERWRINNLYIYIMNDYPWFKK